MTNCVRKNLTILSLFVSFTNCIASDFLPIKKKSVFAASSLSGIRLLHNSHGFAINNNGRIQPVQSYDVDPQLRSITPKQLAAFIKNDGRFVVNKLGDDYSVRMGGGLKGGGVIGATIGAFTGKFIVHAAAQGAYAVISGGVGLICPPAAPAVWAALQLTCAGPVEVASNVAAVAGGIAVGTVTGPI